MQTQRLIIHGHLAPARFLPWIDRHAAKLGMVPVVAHACEERIEIDLAGPDALIDMMEVGCLLGPIDAQVVSIDRL